MSDRLEGTRPARMNSPYAPATMRAARPDARAHSSARYDPGLPRAGQGKA